MTTMANKKLTDAEGEIALKLEKLSIEIANIKLDLTRKCRQERNAARIDKLDLRTTMANAEKAELELDNARRINAQAKAADVENGEYMFCEEISWNTVRDAILKLNELSRRFPGKPLTVTLYSPGGFVMPCLGLYDQIRDLSRRGHHMTVKVRGMAASMGAVLLQAGNTRVVGAESMILIHEVSSGAEGKVSEMQDHVNFNKTLWDKLAQILAKRSRKLTAKQIKRKAFKYDWWLSAKQAKNLGFADEIN